MIGRNVRESDAGRDPSCVGTGSTGPYLTEVILLPESLVADQFDDEVADGAVRLELVNALLQERAHLFFTTTKLLRFRLGGFQFRLVFLNDLGFRAGRQGTHAGVFSIINEILRDIGEIIRHVFTGLGVINRALVLVVTATNTAPCQRETALET